MGSQHMGTSHMTSALGLLLEEAETNETIRKMYVRHNCKHCHGKGMVTFSLPVTFEKLCDCVVRTIKRELKKV